MLSIAFLEVTVSLCSFARKCFPHTQVWTVIICLPTILSSKGFLVKKADGSAYNSLTCVLFLKTNVSCILLISLHRLLNGHVFKSQSFIKLFIFTTSSGHFPYKCILLKNIFNSTVWRHHLDLG